MPHHVRHELKQVDERIYLSAWAGLGAFLVIVVGLVAVRAQATGVHPEPLVSEEPTTDEIASLAEADRVMRHAEGLESGVREIQTRAEAMEFSIDERRRERHQLNVLMTAARLELDERRKALSQAEQQQVTAEAEVRRTEKNLQETKAQMESLQREKELPLKLEHLPTPLAKTVFGSEEHFRLEKGRLTYVPLNELTERLREEAPARAARLLQVPEITETIGPIQGFNMRYTMHRRAVGAVTGAGTVVRQVAELKQFEMVPTSDDLGEPLTEALQPGSQFRQLLETFKPGGTVVTVWTYPDSYAEFRELKRWLFDRQFSCAARPLPPDQLISGSPSGSRSAAQ